MFITEMLGGVITVTDFAPGSVSKADAYQFVDNTWKQWIESESVENNGYWRTMTNQNMMDVLNIEMQKFIDSQAQRAQGSVGDESN